MDKVEFSKQLFNHLGGCVIKETTGDTIYDLFFKPSPTPIAWPERKVTETEYPITPKEYKIYDTGFNKGIEACEKALSEHIENYKILVQDAIDDENKIKDLARPYLSKMEIEGDSYGVPGPVDVVESLIKLISKDVSERELKFKKFDDDDFFEILKNYISEGYGDKQLGDCAKEIAWRANQCMKRRLTLSDPEPKPDLNEEKLAKFLYDDYIEALKINIPQVKFDSWEKLPYEDKMYQCFFLKAKAISQRLKKK